jgi:hypothetical protein
VTATTGIAESRIALEILAANAPLFVSVMAPEGAEPPQHAERRVVRDRMKPRAETVDGRSVGERAVRPEQGVLHGFVGVVVTHHPGAVAHEPRPVSVDDRLERRLRTEPDQLGQPFVALHPRG